MPAERQRLPTERHAITHRFQIGEHKGYLTLGFFDDGKIGEIFIRMNKVGSAINGLLDALSISVSIGLQYHVPIETFIKKFKDTRYEPSGWTAANLEIQTAKSITDYIFRWIELKYCATRPVDASVDTEPPMPLPTPSDPATGSTAQNTASVEPAEPTDNE